MLTVEVSMVGERASGKTTAAVAIAEALSKALDKPFQLTMISRVNLFQREPDDEMEYYGVREALKGSSGRKGQ